MADDRMARMAEAYKRGILPTEKVPHFEEAMRRGLIPRVEVAAQPKTQAEPSAARALGLGTRGAIEGVGSIADIAMSPIMKGINIANEALGGAPDYFQTSVGAGISNALGLPREETEGERLRGGFIRGGAAAIPTLGAGVAMQAANKAPAVAEALASSPILQMLSGATGGGATELAAQGGAGPVGQMAAGVGGAFVPSVASLAAGGARAAGRTAIAPFTESGRNLRAASTIEKLAQDAAAAKSALAGGATELIEGSQPTLAQVTQDPGLASLEQAMMSRQGGSAINQRYTAQKEAQRIATGDVLDPAQARIEQQLSSVEPELRAASQYGGRLGEEQVGRGVREAFNAEKSTARAQRNAAYQAVDPEGAARFDIRPLADGIREEIGKYGKFAELSMPAEVKSALNIMDNAIQEGQTLSYGDLQGARNVFSSAAQNAERGTVQEAMAQSAKRTVDDYIERLAMDPAMMGEAPVPQAGSAAYRDATRAAREAVASDPHFDNLKYMAERGISRDSLEAAIGVDGVRDLNSRVPGLVRKGGKLNYDELAGELGYTPDYMPSSGQDLIEELQRRFSGNMARPSEAVKNVRDQYLGSNAAQKHTGFTPEQSAKYREAKALGLDYNRRFKTGVAGEIGAQGDKSGNYRVREAEIPAKVVASGPSGAQKLREIERAGLRSEIPSDVPFGTPDTVQGYLKDYVIGKAAEIKTTQGLRDFIKNHGPALQELGDTDLQNTLNTALKNLSEGEAKKAGIAELARRDQGGEWVLKHGRVHPSPKGNIALTPQEQQRISAVQQDVQRALDAMRLGQVGGSQTARNLNMQNALGQFGLKGGGVIKGMINEMLGKVTSQGNEAVENIILNAILNPQNAAELMNMQRPEAFRQMLGRIGTAGTVSAGREALRR